LYLISAHLNAYPEVKEWDTYSSHFKSGGMTFSVHQPTKAAQWVENNYDHRLLRSIRDQGLGGPVALMLFPTTPALAIFGESDNENLYLSRKLAILSDLPVVLRPLEDRPNFM
jgi:hypothetical protein